jgi:uncharacterized protein
LPADTLPSPIQLPAAPDNWWRFPVDQQQDDSPEPKGAGLVSNQTVAFIITHTIRAGEEASYESWLKEILQAVSLAPGYLGREIFRPVHGTHTYTSILRFATSDHLQAWTESPTRKGKINQVRELLTKGDVYEIRTGIDFWFTPAAAKPPKSWKQYLLVLSAIYPLTQLVPWVLSPIFKLSPTLAQPQVKGLIIAICIVALMTYVVMPHYTRLMRRWLYAGND